MNTAGTQFGSTKGVCVFETSISVIHTSTSLDDGPLPSDARYYRGVREYGIVAIR